MELWKKWEKFQVLFYTGQCTETFHIQWYVVNITVHILNIGHVFLLGEQFNDLARWVQEDNETGIYYETWTVRSDPGANSTTWFESYDCSQFVHRTYRKMADLGAKLSSKTQTNYTKIYLYSGEPTYLGDDDTIFGQSSMKTLAMDIKKFYHSFQPHQSMVQFIISLMETFEKVVVEKIFYLYYNFEYWHLPMKAPYIQITYEEVPLPH